MSLTTDLPAYLLAQSSISAIVGTDIYPVHADQGEVYPCLVFMVISDVPLESHDGPSGLSFAHIQFSCFAKQYADARSLRDALKLLLEGFKGTLTPGTASVSNVRYLSDHDTFEPLTRVFHTIVEMEIEYSF